MLHAPKTRVLLALPPTPLKMFGISRYVEPAAFRQTLWLQIVRATDSVNRRLGTKEIRLSKGESRWAPRSAGNHVAPSENPNVR